MSIPAEPSAQPVSDIVLGEARIRLLGTAHVSRASAAAVGEEIASGDYDCVAIELCASRHRAMVEPDALQQLDLFQVIREGKAAMVTAMLALGAFQQRVAEQLGVQPGAEMRAAIEGARASGVDLAIIDRDIGVTLRRVYRNVSWWQRLYLFSGLIASVIARDEVGEAEIERLKQGDLLESTFAQFASEAQAIYEPLIAERDRYMAAKLVLIAAAGRGRILAVIGAGHLKGIREHLSAGALDPEATIAGLSAIPPASRWVKAIPWAIVLFIVAGIGIGFARSPEIGLSMLMDWVLFTGGLSALGTLAAGGHPLSVASALVGAPFTTLHPAIGIGFFTAMVEAYLRRPTVGDFTRLREDTAHWRGWWRNRVARTLLVFVFSTLGAALGTYIAGFRIGSQLL